MARSNRNSATISSSSGRLDSSSSSAVTTGKRRRKPSGLAERPSKRKNGKGAKILDLPLEISNEILSYVGPYELLRLARTSGVLRKFLMKRSSSELWKQAIVNMDMPDCPQDMSEPAFSHLVFERMCSFCGTSPIDKIFWVWRVRMCHKCLERYQIKEDEMRSDIFIPQHVRHHPIVEGCLWEMMLSTRDPGLPDEDEGESTIYFKSDIIDFCGTIGSLEDDDEAIRAFCVRRLATVKERTKYAKKCQAWYDKWQDSRRSELAAARVRRENQIVERLTQLGWRDELQKLDKCQSQAFATHPAISQPKPLTDRIWGNIKKQVIDLMAKFKHDREQAEMVVKREQDLRHALEIYIRSRPRSELQPNISDVCTAPELSYYIHAPPHFGASEELFRILVNDHMRSIRQRWWDDIFEDVLPSLVLTPTFPPADGQDIADTEKPPFSKLRLVTTWFRCNECEELLRYRRITVHKCVTKMRTQSYLGAQECYGRLGCESARFGLRWKVRFCEESKELATRLAQQCKLDAETRQKDVAGQHMFIECRKGSKTMALGKRGARAVMPFLTAVEHAFKKHPNELDSIVSQYLPLEKQDSARAAVVMDRTLTSMIERTGYLTCSVCLRSSMTFKEILRHFQTEHQEKWEKMRDTAATTLIPSPTSKLYIPDEDLSYSVRWPLVVLNDDARVPSPSRKKSARKLKHRNSSPWRTAALHPSLFCGPPAENPKSESNE